MGRLLCELGWVTWAVVVALLSPITPVTAGPLALDSAITNSNGTIPDYVIKHAPLLYLHSQDPFKPADILTHLQHTTPYLRLSPIPDLPPPSLSNLAALNEFGRWAVFLTSTENPLTSPPPSWLFGSTPDASGQVHDAVPCTVILVENGPGVLDAFYFYFYSYDRGANITQVMKPLNALLKDDGGGMHFGDHVGDWEHNMIRFEDGEPTGIYFSQHSDGQAMEWDDPELSKVDGRPIIYSAYGSHANYPSPGTHIHDACLLDWCDAGVKWDPVLSAYFYNFDSASRTVTPLTPTSNETSWLQYRGHWGDARYPDNDPRQQIVPYFKIPRLVGGPTGPMVKGLRRKGLFPDRRHRKGWLEWGVGVFMSWYPCCLSGWKGWVAIVVVLGILVASVTAVIGGIVWGMKHAVRLSSRKGYEKVGMDEEEIDLDEIEARWAEGGTDRL